MKLNSYRLSREPADTMKPVDAAVQASLHFQRFIVSITALAALHKITFHNSNETPYRYFRKISTYSNLTKRHIVISLKTHHFAPH